MSMLLLPLKVSLCAVAHGSFFLQSQCRCAPLSPSLPSHFCLSRLRQGKNSVAMRLHRIRSNTIQDNLSFQQNGQLLILSFRLYAWVYMCSHMCEHIYVLHGGVRVGVHPEVILSCFSVSTHLVFRDGISPSLGLTDATRLAGWPALGLLLSLPSQSLDYKCVSP